MCLTSQDYFSMEKGGKGKGQAQNTVGEYRQTKSLFIPKDGEKAKEKRDREQDKRLISSTKRPKMYNPQNVLTDEDGSINDGKGGLNETSDMEIEEIKPLEEKKFKVKPRTRKRRKVSIYDSRNYVSIDDTLSATDEDLLSESESGDDLTEKKIISEQKLKNQFKRIKNKLEKKSKNPKNTTRMKYTGKQTLTTSKRLDQRITIKTTNTNKEPFIPLFRGISFNPQTEKKERKCMRDKARKKELPVHKLNEFQQKITESIFSLLNNKETIKNDDIEKYFKGYIGKKSGKTPTLDSKEPETWLHVLIHLYSSNYDKFLEYWSKLAYVYDKNQMDNLSATQLFNKVNELKIKHDMKKDIEKFRFNPVVSFGDVPLHAVKYAMGDKVYDKNYKSTLQPIYTESGKPKHPYMGIVSIMLFSPSEIENSPHLTTLNKQDRVNLLSHVEAERESQFWGEVPPPQKKRYIITKFPDFSKKYDGKFKIRYGIDAEDFNTFKKVWTKAKNNTYELAFWEDILTKYLTFFYEWKAWAIANRLAGEQGLAFRDDKHYMATLPKLKNQIARGLKRKSKKTTNPSPPKRRKKLGDNGTAKKPVRANAKRVRKG